MLVHCNIVHGRLVVDSKKELGGVSTREVANHLGAMAAVVKVGAVLEHASVTARLAATAAAAERTQ